MYPFIRVLKGTILSYFQRPLPLDGIHESQHICWPWDMDFWGEMNNGLMLCVYDMGRIPFSVRIGLGRLLFKNRWGFAMVGISVRYRRRVRLFHRFKMTTGMIGRDEKFLYLLQTMWRKGEAVSSVLYRTAITDKNGIVPTQEVFKQFDAPEWNPEMPEWVRNWIKAEGSRVWPPEF